MEKALLIKTNANMDMSDILQVAKLKEVSFTANLIRFLL